jgi:hypothetical protein
VMSAHHISSYLECMSDASTGQQHNNAGRYEIRLQGHLGSRWAAWFDGLTLTNESDGTTVLQGQLVDQAELHGLLQKLRDVGLPLVSVTHVETKPEAPTTDSQQQPTPMRRKQ